LDRGAEVNARATLNQSGVDGQTPLFHAVTQFDDVGLPMVGLLLERGADLSVPAKLPGYYERPDELVECTPLGYALRFPGLSRHAANPKTRDLLRDRGAPE
jgi:ankyrin repeat protein